MLLRNIRLILLAGFAGLTLFSCEKAAKNEIDGEGNNLVRIRTTGDVTPVLFTADAVVQTGEVAEVWRDVVSQSFLNQATSVKLAADNSLINAYNTAHAENFEPLPSASYTIDPLDVDFEPGQFLRSLKIRLNPSTLDLTKKYALAFKIANAGAGYGISNGRGSGIYRILITNKYHGSYRSTGNFEHPTAPRTIDKDKFLTTTGPSTVETEFGDLGSSGWKMKLTVNSDNTISMVPSGASNTTAALMFDDPNYNNKYNPATRTYWIKYGYPMPGPTRIITEKITLK